MRPDEALTVIAGLVQQSAEAIVGSFNRSQSFSPHGVQVSISHTRAMAAPSAAPAPFCSACNDADDETWCDVCEGGVDITDEGRAELARGGAR